MGVDVQKFILFLLFKVLEARAVSTILLDKVKSNRIRQWSGDSLIQPQLNT